VNDHQFPRVWWWKMMVVSFYVPFTCVPLNANGDIQALLYFKGLGG
jgi:hypothetical protein